MTKKIQLVELTQERLADFYQHLAQHSIDNGSNNQPLFQPQSRTVVEMPTEKKYSFEKSLTIPLFTLGWRRAWLAQTDNNAIAGHIDLRSHPNPHTEHRAVLGMGVLRGCRRQGVGETMLVFVEDWARNTKLISWIDLQVLGENKPAIAFYEKMGFLVVGRMQDFYRIDGNSETQVLMSKSLV